VGIFSVEQAATIFHWALSHPKCAAKVIDYVFNNTAELKETNK